MCFFMFFPFDVIYGCFILQGACQRFALAAGGEKTAWEQEKLKARKMLVNRAESHPSTARYVGTLFVMEWL